MLNLFARGYEDDIHNDVSKYHSPMSLNCLLFLYKAALHNKHFVVALTSVFFIWGSDINFLFSF